MRDVPDDKVSVIVIWEPVIPSDLRPPGRSVTAPLNEVRAERYWDEDLLASKSMVRTALKSPEKIPEDFDVDESFVVWDLVAIWPPGTLWEQDMPWPEWFGYPVVAAEGELEHRLDAARMR